ncbi:MAG: hypothetical protein AAB415_01680 [Patescibacteria group bacterium]
MSNDQMTINPEGADFYRPSDGRKRGSLPALIIKLSGGKIDEAGANRVLLGFAIIVFIISVIILITTL